MERQALDQLRVRNAEQEVNAAIEHGHIAFYAVGSLVDGYSLPGLNQEEVFRLEAVRHEIVNEFPTDPAPLWATKKYWDEVQRFAATYNRMLYRRAMKIRPNQSLEPMARYVTPRAGHESRRLSPWLTIKR